jgi:hypothetical protein
MHIYAKPTLICLYDRDAIALYSSILTDKYIEEYLGLVAGFENIRNTSQTWKYYCKTKSSKYIPCPLNI